MTMFDSEKFLEKLEEVKPVVIFVNNGEVVEVYLPEGETSPQHLVIECDEDDDSVESTEHDVFVEILESCGYTATTACEYTDFIDVSICEDDECIYGDDE